MGEYPAYGGNGHVSFEDGLSANNTRVQENRGKARGWLILEEDCTAADLYGVARAAVDSSIGRTTADPNAGSTSRPARYLNQPGTNNDNNNDTYKSNAIIYLGDDGRTLFVKRDILIKSSNLQTMCTDIDMVLQDGVMFIIHNTTTAADAYLKDWRIKIMDRERPRHNSAGAVITDGNGSPTGRSKGGDAWIIGEYQANSLQTLNRGLNPNGKRMLTLDGTTITNIGDRIESPWIGIKDAISPIVSKTQVDDADGTLDVPSIEQFAVRASGEFYDLTLRHTERVRAAANNVRFIIHDLFTSDDGASYVSAWKRSSLMINNWERVNLGGSETFPTQVGGQAGTAGNYRIFLLGTAAQYYPDDPTKLDIAEGAGNVNTEFEVISGGLHYHQVFKDGVIFDDFKFAYIDTDGAGNEGIRGTKPITTHGEMLDDQDNGDNSHADGLFAYVSREMRRHHDTNWTNEPFTHQRIVIRHPTTIHYDDDLTAERTIDGVTRKKSVISEGRSDGLYIPIAISRDLDYTGDTDPAPSWGTLTVDWATKTLTIPFSGDTTFTLQDIYNWFKQELAKPANLAREITATRVGSKLDMSGWRISLSEQSSGEVTIRGTDRFDAIELRESFVTGTITTNIIPTVITPGGITIRYTRNAVDANARAKITPPLPADDDGVNTASYVNFGASGSLACDADQEYRITMKVDGCYEMQATFDTTDTFSVHYNFTRIPPIDLDTLNDAALATQVDNANVNVLTGGNGGTPLIHVSFDAGNILTIHGGTTDTNDDTMGVGIDTEGNLDLTIRLIDRALKENGGLDFFDFYLQQMEGTADNERLSGAPLHGHAIEYESDLMHIDDRAVNSSTRVRFQKDAPLDKRVRFGVPVFGRMSGVMRMNRYIAPIDDDKGALIFDNVATIVQNVITGGGSGGGATAQEIWEYAATRLPDNTTTVGGIIKENLDGSVDAVNDNLLQVKTQTDKLYFSNADTGAPSGKERLRVFERELWGVPVADISANSIGSLVQTMVEQWPTFRGEYTGTLATHLTGLTSGSGGSGGASAAQIWNYPIASITGMNTVGTAVRDYLNSSLSDIDGVVDTISNAVGVVLQHLGSDVAFETPITINKRVKDSLAILNKLSFVGPIDSNGKQKIDTRASLTGTQLADLTLTASVTGLTEEQSAQFETLYNSIIVTDTAFHNPDIPLTHTPDGITAISDTELLTITGTQLYTVPISGFVDAYATQIDRALTGITLIGQTIYGVDSHHDIYSMPFANPTTTTLVYNDPDTTNPSDVYGLTHVDNNLYWLRNNNESYLSKVLRNHLQPTPIACAYGRQTYFTNTDTTAFIYIDSNNIIRAFDDASNVEVHLPITFDISSVLGANTPIAIGVSDDYFYVMDDTGTLYVWQASVFGVTPVYLRSVTVHTSTTPLTTGDIVTGATGAVVNAVHITSSAITHYSILTNTDLTTILNRYTGVIKQTDDRSANFTLPAADKYFYIQIYIGDSNGNYTVVRDQYTNSPSARPTNDDFYPTGLFNGATLMASNQSGIVRFDETTARFNRGPFRTRPSTTLNLRDASLAYDGTNIYSVTLYQSGIGGTGNSDYAPHVRVISPSTGQDIRDYHVAITGKFNLNTPTVNQIQDVAIYGGDLYAIGNNAGSSEWYLMRIQNPEDTSTNQASITAVATSLLAGLTRATNVDAMVFNGDTLYVCENRQIRAYDMANSRARITASDFTLAAANTDTVAMAVYDGHLYTLDGADKKIYVYDLSDGSDTTSTAVLPDILSPVSVHGIEITSAGIMYMSLVPAGATTTTIVSYDLTAQLPAYELFTYDTTDTVAPVVHETDLPRTTHEATVTTDGTYMYVLINHILYRMSLNPESIGDVLGTLHDSADSDDDSRIIEWRDSIWHYDGTADRMEVLHILNNRRGTQTTTIDQVKEKTNQLTFSSGNLHTDVYAVAGDGVTGLEDFKGFRSDDSTALEAIQNDAKLTRQILANKYTFTADTPAAGQTTLKIFADDGTTVLKEIVIETSGDRTAATDPDA